MKGQAVFEFVVAVILFLGIIFYVINFLNSSVSNYSDESRLNTLEVKALEISEYLMHIGFTDDWPILSYQKLRDFNDTCNNDYAGTLERLDLEGSKLKLEANESSTVLLDCEQNVAVPDIQKAEVQRLALSPQHNIINVRVVVW